MKYTVKNGDTLWGISKKFHVTVQELKKWNQLSSDLIFPGQELTIYSETNKYTVVKGDTLWSISKRFDVSVTKLKQLNALTSDIIYPGQLLVVKENHDEDQYTVLKGDTLWSISQKFQLTVDQLKKQNGLTSDIIYPGQVLRLSKDLLPPSQLISHGPKNQKQIALTFDAGSGIEGIKILDILKKHRVPCTMFLTGKWVEKYQDYTKRLVNDGHELANHSYSHANFTNLSYDEIKREMKLSHEAIVKYSGKNPQPFFRFPYGAYNETSLKAVGEAGYPYSIHWTIDTLDWKQPEAETIVSRIENNASNGDIILMHFGGKNTPTAIDIVIPRLKAKGFEPVTISKLFS